MRPLPFCLIPKHPYINIPEFRRWDRGTYHPSTCRSPSWYWSQKKIKEGEKRRQKIPWKNSLQSFVCEKEPCLFLQEPTCYNLLNVPSIWGWRIPLQDWIGEPPVSSSSNGKSVSMENFNALRVLLYELINGYEWIWMVRTLHQYLSQPALMTPEGTVSVYPLVI